MAPPIRQLTTVTPVANWPRHVRNSLRLIAIGSQPLESAEHLDERNVGRRALSEAGLRIAHVASHDVPLLYGLGRAVGGIEIDMVAVELGLLVGLRRFDRV